ncbi:hypothetical protein HHI36_000640 [Cryptolaemus montrouzieri]|uniref:Uncharacterized protein n=1 Tax=Cryptolaemus montrouzieri TaxID=559131 RepID=A0ABD2P666_9CUCU
MCFLHRDYLDIVEHYGKFVHCPEHKLKKTVAAIFSIHSRNHFCNSKILCFSSSTGAGSNNVLIGLRISFSSIQPHTRGSNSFPNHV